ncbi:MAG: PilZ domain-containing protein [Vulcanimicrobiota bacterium]
MRWSILDIRNQKKNVQEDERSSRKAPELFQPDLCRMKTLIQSDKEVAVYYLSTEEIAFKTDVVLQVGQKTPLTINYHRWKPIDAHEKVDSVVTITATGKAQGGAFLYKGQFRPDNGFAMKTFFDYLRQISSGITDDDREQDSENRRRSIRLDRVLPIMSKEIEGFKALTENISLGGAMLLCSGGRISRGDIINLRLDLDEYEALPLQFKAEVCWVVPDESNKMKVGVEFLDLDETKKERLTKYIENVQKLSRWMNRE